MNFNKNMVGKRFKAGKFIGKYYVRGGTLKDKHGNIRKVPVTLRNNKTGYIINLKGKFLGIEKNRHHQYGSDPRKIKKPKTFVRPNLPTALKPRSSHMRRLR